MYSCPKTGQDRSNSRKYEIWKVWGRYHLFNAPNSIFLLRVEIHRILYKIHHISKKNIDHFAVKSVLMNPYVVVRTAPNTIHKHSIVNNHGGETLISKKPFLIYEFEYSPKVNVCLFVRIQKSLLF